MDIASRFAETCLFELPDTETRERDSSPEATQIRSESLKHVQPRTHTPPASILDQTDTSGREGQSIGSVLNRGGVGKIQ